MDHPEIGFTVVRGTFECKWCDKAIELLESKGLQYSVRKMGMADLIVHQAEVGHHTVPIVMHGVKLVGGFSELEAYLDG